ncbi:MAG TPA: SpoIIE family protein phosphatase [Thermoanaerobaculia bacterium]|nr:SpoIIE family protein phosphatase [Thermoanaerobaculia bacterium]
MSAPPPNAELTVNSPLFPPFRQPLEGTPVSIGRASDCSLPIKDRYLSRRHAEIVPVDGSWLLKDLGSVNGTYLNGMRVERDTPLRTGDRIRLGDTEILFETPEHNTDRFFAVADTAERPSIAIPIQEIDHGESGDVARLQTLNVLARDLIEDRPMNELFGFIVERIMQHLEPSRAAIALLGADGRSFSHVELRRRDRDDQSELTISNTLLTAIVEERKALAFVDVSSDAKLSGAHSIVMQGIRSIVAAPLTIGDSVMGLLYVDYLFAQKAISAEDVRLLAQIARFAAKKLETTKLREEAIEKRIMDEELKTASNIQRRLLPAAPAGIEGYSFVGVNQPCRTVSGDYYDFVVRPDGRVYFVIGDVSGKGVTAGLMMAGLQVAFRIFSKSDPDPATLVTQLNGALREILPRSKFVTLFLGRLDTTTGMVEYVNAGHTPPLWIRGSGVEEVLAGDVLLGVVSAAEYFNRRLQLEAGDALILYTDGVSEAQSATGTELGAEALAGAFGGLHGAGATAVANRVADVVLSHVGEPDALDDDVTIVVVSRDGAGAQADLDSTVHSWPAGVRAEGER